MVGKTVGRYKKTPMKILSFILIIFFTANSNNFHQDRILKINENGKIIGLPKEYSPAQFNIKKGYLRIRNKELTFPTCIKYYFNIHPNPKLTLSASWYHSKEIMPYYLNFVISQKNKDYTYSILVNLETLELMFVEVSILQGNSIYSNELKTDEKCMNEYKIKCITN